MSIRCGWISWNPVISRSVGYGRRERGRPAAVELPPAHRTGGVAALRKGPSRKSPPSTRRANDGVDLVRLLLANGADVEPRNEAPDDGTYTTVQLPLKIACQKHHVGGAAPRGRNGLSFVIGSELREYEENI